MGCGASAGIFGRKRLHGGEDQCQTLRYVLVWCTGQSWSVACGVSTWGKHLFGSAILELYRDRIFLTC